MWGRIKAEMSERRGGTSGGEERSDEWGGG